MKNDKYSIFDMRNGITYIGVDAHLEDMTPSESIHLENVTVYETLDFIKKSVVYGTKSRLDKIISIHEKKVQEKDCLPDFNIVKKYVVGGTDLTA